MIEELAVASHLTFTAYLAEWYVFEVSETYGSFVEEHQSDREEIPEEHLSQNSVDAVLNPIRTAAYRLHMGNESK